MTFMAHLAKLSAESAGEREDALEAIGNLLWDGQKPTDAIAQALITAMRDTSARSRFLAVWAVSKSSDLQQRAEIQFELRELLFREKRRTQPDVTLLSELEYVIDHLPASVVTPPPLSLPQPKALVMRDSAFISYSREDKEWLDRIKIFLKPLERAGIVKTWYDELIKPGDIWRDELNEGCA